MKILILLIGLALTASFVNAQEYERNGVDTTQPIPKGINVGEKAPQIKTTSIDGVPIDTDQLSKNKSVVVLFYRGEWCPICNRYLSNIQDSLSLIEENNAVVIAIGPETTENVIKTQEKSNTNFILISDSSLEIEKQYDVLFHVTEKYQKKIKTYLRTSIAKNNGAEDAFLPVPATYIIRDGVIVYKHFDIDYRNRASAKQIIDNLHP